MLASGSSGNAIYVRVGDVRVLVDVGISRRRIVRALGELDVSMDQIDAIVLTHEHSDHVSGLPMLRKHHPGIPIFCTEGTARGCVRRKRWDQENHHPIEAGDVLRLGHMRLMPFATSHDVNEPVGLRIEGPDTALGIATDLGRSTSTVLKALEDCRAVVLEANHDVERLWRGPYPLHLKRRVVSPRGHLSNEQMRDVLGEIATENLRSVVLAHLSDKNNTPELALGSLGTSLSNAPKALVTVAERESPSPLMAF